MAEDETPKMQVRQPIRNRPGTRRQDWYRDAPNTIEAMDSSFAVQQYLEQLRLRQTSTVQNMLELPVGTDESLWLYEHMRLLCVQLNDFIVALQQVCAGDKMPECHEMKAGEWLYLCASHQTPQNCSAIDYCVHTLDAAIAVLNSNKFFPSRVSVPQASMKQFPSIARRLYRIFAHAWYHHREVFDAFEEKFKLYERMVRLADQYELIPQKLVVIPGYEMKNAPADDA